MFQEVSGVCSTAREHSSMTPKWLLLFMVVVLLCVLIFFFPKEKNANILWPHFLKQLDHFF